MPYRTPPSSTLRALVVCAAVTSCSPAASTGIVTDEIALPTPSAATREPVEPARVPRDPFILAAVESAGGDLVVTPTHLYWLEIRSRAARPPRTSAATTARGLIGFGGALMCDDAGGALMRVDRKTGRRDTAAALDYRPFSLAYDGKRLYWTGAPCTGRAATSGDPDWLWAFDTTTGEPPTTLGERDRNYLDIVTTPGAAFVSDRFGKGGAFRFVDGGSAESIVPDKEQPWVVAADARSFFWADAARTLWETDLSTRKATKHTSLGDMPSDAHLFDGGLVVRTTSELLVLSRPAMTITKRIALPRYGDRGSGTLVGGRYYLWAEGTDRISRLDVTTGAVTSAVTTAAKEAHSVAFDDDTLYWLDRKRNAILVWPSPRFTAAP